MVPVFFAGQNSRLFQIASHINLALRLSLIFKEVRDRIGTTLPVAIGDPIPFAEIAHLADRKALADELRQRTYALETGLAPLLPKRPRRGHRLVRIGEVMKQRQHRLRARLARRGRH